MASRKGVTLIVDKKFFAAFDRKRTKEQDKLRQKLGGLFNLSQRNFSAMVEANQMKFDFPNQRMVKNKVRKRRTTRRRTG